MNYLFFGLMVFFGFFPMLAPNLGPVPVFWAMWLLMAVVELFEHRRSAPIPGWKFYAFFALALVASQVGAVRWSDSLSEAVALASIFATIPFIGVRLREARVRGYVVALSALGTIAVCLYMIFYSSVPLGPDFDPTFGPLNFTINNAGFAIAIGTALLWPVVFAPNSLIRTKLGCLAVIALSFYTILFFVGSRSGFLGILVGGMVSAFFAPGARAYVHKIVLVILASSVILLTGYFAYTNQMLPSVINKRAERLLNPLSDGSAMLRVSFAKKAWLLFLDHPIYGGGWGNFLYYEYRQVAPVVVAGHSTRWVGSDTKWPHSIYFKMLSETGLLGTLAFAMLLIWLTASILKVVRWHPGDNSPWVWFFVFLFFSLFHEMMGYLTCVCFALLQGYLIEQLPMAEAKRPPKAKEAAFLPHEQFADRWARSRQ